jgi:hypothetical protein
MDANHSDARETASQAVSGPTSNPARGRPALRVIQGEGQGREVKVRSRTDLAGVLVGAAGDLLLHRISSLRAQEIERKVDKLMVLFDRVDQHPLLQRVLQRELDDLEALVRESAERRPMKASR